MPNFRHAKQEILSNLPNEYQTCCHLQSVLDQEYSLISIKSVSKFWDIMKTDLQSISRTISQM